MQALAHTPFPASIFREICCLIAVTLTVSLPDARLRSRTASAGAVHHIVATTGMVADLVRAWREKIAE